MDIQQVLELVNERVEPTKRKYGDYSYKVLDDDPKKPLEQKLINRGIRIIVIGDRSVPTEHGRTSGWLKSGRGAVISDRFTGYEPGDIWIEGGSRGSQTAHPVGKSDHRFYWGIKKRFIQDYDALVFNQKSTGTNEWINNNLPAILYEMLSQRLL